MIKYKVRISLSDIARDARHMFLVEYSLRNPRFCSRSTPTDFYGCFFLFVKPSLLMSYDSLLHECIFFSFRLFPWQVILSSNLPKKQTTLFWFRLVFNAIKQL